MEMLTRFPGLLAIQTEQQPGLLAPVVDWQRELAIRAFC
jgi:hypothetical protein